MVFTIDTDHNITAFAERPADAQGEAFGTEKELAKLAAAWNSTRVVDIWNSFAGVAPFDDLKPVKKFTDRKAGVSRIWKAVQRLTPVAAPQVANVAPETEGTGKGSPPPPRRPPRLARPSGSTRRQTGPGVMAARRPRSWRCSRNPAV
jgi:hypothetical protein